MMSKIKCNVKLCRYNIDGGCEYKKYAKEKISIDKNGVCECISIG